MSNSYTFKSSEDKRTLFQYMSMDKCLSILRNRALPLRDFFSYNDPFECLPEFSSYADLLPIFSASNEKQREEMIVKQLDIIGEKYNFSENLLAGLKKGILTSSFLKFTPLSIAAAFAIGASVSSLFISSSAKKASKNSIALKTELFLCKFIPYLANLYTSCFTVEKGNILMWSHYANSHKGVVMEFDTSYKPFTKGCVNEMTYSDRRFDFSVQDYKKDSDMEDLVTVLLSTKGSDWRYEQEHRLIYNIKQNKDEIIWRDKYNNPHVKLEEDGIKCIYLGRRTPEMEKQKLRMVLMENNLDTKINLCEVKLSRTGYRMVFEGL